MSNRWLIDGPQNFWSLIASISLWLHWLVIDFSHYSSISSRGCKRIWWWKTKLNSLNVNKCFQIKLQKVLQYFKMEKPFSMELRFSSIFLFVGPHLTVAPSRLFSFANCTIENHLYWWLALCISRSSTGTSDTRKNASNTDKTITNEKQMVQESKKSFLRAQYNTRWVINGSSISNQLHQWVVDIIDE